MNKLDANFWQNKYLNEQTGWDIGNPSPALTKFFDSLENKSLKILIPGGGNAYELDYLFKLGFKNIFLVDWAEKAIENVKKRNPNFPAKQLICENFFEHNESYDLIIEQTFFCALHPNLRVEYVKKMHQLLKPNGQLVGVLFNIEFEREGPPFGGNIKSYKQLFSPLFHIKKLESCYNSIKPRQGSELFFIFQKLS